MFRSGAARGSVTASTSPITPETCRKPTAGHLVSWQSGWSEVLLGLAPPGRAGFGWHPRRPHSTVLKSIDYMPVKTTLPGPASTRPNPTKVSTTPTKVGFVSLGCPKNLVDSEVMMGMLAQAGVRLVSEAEDADVIVVNTCSFIASAQQESVNTILEMAKHKTEGKAKKLIVAGCLVERFRDQISKDIPEVDAVVGTGELENILAAAGIAPAPVRSDSPFVVLPSRAEGDERASQGRFSRESWDG